MLCAVCLFLFSRDKAKEFQEWLRTLESEKFDHLESLKRQKYEVRDILCDLLYSERHPL